MATQTQQTTLAPSPGHWMVVRSKGLPEIIDDDTGKQIALVENMGDAVLMSCAKEMLEALINIADHLESIQDETVRNQIAEHTLLAFEKLNAESDV